MKLCKWSLCLMACLLLCACSHPPGHVPPEDSRMITGYVELTENQISSLSVSAVRGEVDPEYYRCRMENGVACMLDWSAEGAESGDLTYGQFDLLLEKLMLRLKEDGLGMANPQAGNYIIHYDQGSQGKNYLIAQTMGSLPGSTGTAVGYYVYSLGGKTFTTGDGTNMGEDAFGVLTVRNDSTADAAAGLLDQWEYVCILIDP